MESKEREQDWAEEDAVFIKNNLNICLFFQLEGDRVLKKVWTDFTGGLKMG